MNTVENNKIIAEFMGCENPDSWELIPSPYQCDWNWLMEVIDKLKEVWEEPEELDNLKDALWWDNIRGVYEMVVDLIKEYNEQKSA